MSSSTAGLNCAALYKCYPSLSGAGISTPNPVDCVDGEICPAGTAVPQLCKPGTYMSETGPLDSYRCSSCPIDYYCPEWGITKVYGPKPYTNYPCPPGYLCLGSAVHPSNRDNVSIQFCPVGYFCDKSISNGGVSKQKCPINWFSNVEGQDKCLPCPAGFICEAIGTITPVACPRGSYCKMPVKTFI